VKALGDPARVLRDELLNPLRRGVPVLREELAQRGDRLDAKEHERDDEQDNRAHRQDRGREPPDLAEPRRELALQRIEQERDEGAEEDRDDERPHHPQKEPEEQRSKGDGQPPVGPLFGGGARVVHGDQRYSGGASVNLGRGDERDGSASSSALLSTAGAISP
jgi:hypothetical protein